MKRVALISVFDKVGIVPFAKALVDLDFDLLASGGTKKMLAENGLPVKDVAVLVGGDAILNHRVVTLSREIHAGLLARDTPEDLAELAQLGIPYIDLVCVDFYPLLKELSQLTNLERVIEKTDVGGPTMIASACKGRRVTICRAVDRSPVIGWLQTGRPDEENFKNKLIATAYQVLRDYFSAATGFYSSLNCRLP